MAWARGYLPPGSHQIVVYSSLQTTASQSQVEEQVWCNVSGSPEVEDPKIQ